MRKRKIKSRHSFDVYEDQVEVLQQLAIEDRMRGGVGSMSAMVREAIDEYVAKVRPHEPLGGGSAASAALTQTTGWVGPT
jgi:hypothetical protein